MFQQFVCVFAKQIIYCLPGCTVCHADFQLFGKQKICMFVKTVFSDAYLMIVCFINVIGYHKPVLLSLQ